MSVIRHEGTSTLVTGSSLTTDRGKCSSQVSPLERPHKQGLNAQCPITGIASTITKVPDCSMPHVSRGPITPRLLSMHGRTLLARVIDRVWENTQAVRTRSEYVAGGITLRLLAQLRAGTAASLDTAAYEVVGCGFKVWCVRDMERVSSLAWELSAAGENPPGEEMEQANSLRREAPSRGTLHTMPQPAKPAQQEPLRKVLGKSAGV